MTAHVYNYIYYFDNKLKNRRLVLTTLGASALTDFFFSLAMGAADW